MSRGLALLPLLAFACGPPPPPKDVFADAARKLDDVAQIRAMLKDRVGYGGLWFADPSCASEFAAPREVPAAELDAFARCVAGLHLTLTQRVQQVADIEVMTYEPGFEVDARITFAFWGPRLVWLGFGGHEVDHDAPPRITLEALSRIRTGGSGVSVPSEARKRLEDDAQLSTSGWAGGWFSICIGADGAVTSVQPYLSMPPDATKTFEAALRTWTFSPFVVADRTMSVCAVVLAAYPQEKVAPRERATVPVPPLDPSLEGFPAGIRVEGSPYIQPSPGVKRELADESGFIMIPVLRLCVDGGGRVVKADLFESSGSSDYDAQLLAAAKTWRYPPRSGCTAIEFNYEQ